MMLTISSGLVNNTGTALATKSSNSILLETVTIAGSLIFWCSEDTFSPSQTVGDLYPCFSIIKYNNASRMTNVHLSVGSKHIIYEFNTRLFC